MKFRQHKRSIFEMRKMSQIMKLFNLIKYTLCVMMQYIRLFVLQFLTFPRLKFEKYDSSDHFPNTNSFLIMTQIKYIECTAISFQSSYLFSIEIHHKRKSNQRKRLKKELSVHKSIHQRILFIDEFNSQVPQKYLQKKFMKSRP